MGTPGSKQASGAPSDGSPHCISIEPPLDSENTRWHRSGVWLLSAATRGGPKQRWRADEKQRGCGGGRGGRGGASVPWVVIAGWDLAAAAAAGSSETWAGKDSTPFLLVTRYPMGRGASISQGGRMCLQDGCIRLAGSGPIDECDVRVRTSGCEKISSSWTAGGALCPSGTGETLREDQPDSDSLPSTDVR